MLFLVLLNMVIKYQLTFQILMEVCHLGIILKCWVYKVLISHTLTMAESPAHFVAITLIIKLVVSRLIQLSQIIGGNWGLPIFLKVSTEIIKQGI